MNELTLILFLFFATLLFMISHGGSRFSKNSRIFIYMVVHLISEKIKEIKARNNKQGRF